MRTASVFVVLVTGALVGLTGCAAAPYDWSNVPVTKAEARPVVDAMIDAALATGPTGDLSGYCRTYAEFGYMCDDTLATVASEHLAFPGPGRPTVAFLTNGTGSQFLSIRGTRLDGTSYVGQIEVDHDAAGNTVVDSPVFWYPQELVSS
ncbi:hypothetical protein [Glaciihabitans sp. dw_435]|uniref:hypothetical protein n=1 Tax=Glaciihabitans sp. dw_435 TaxID=2720081 RepID=UPI001BD3242A|nr:hypothetical protein [Glaciihabitans sp. dw_435]